MPFTAQGQNSILIFTNGRHAAAVFAAAMYAAAFFTAATHPRLFITPPSHSVAFLGTPTQTIILPTPPRHTRASYALRIHPMTDHTLPPDTCIAIVAYALHAIAFAYVLATNTGHNNFRVFLISAVLPGYAFYPVTHHTRS